MVADAKMNEPILFCLCLVSSATHVRDEPKISGIRPKRTLGETDKRVAPKVLRDTQQIKARREQNMPSMKTTDEVNSLAIDRGTFFPISTRRATVKA